MIVNASKRPSKSVACPTSLTMLAETRARKIAYHHYETILEDLLVR